MKLNDNQKRLLHEETYAAGEWEGIKCSDTSKLESDEGGYYITDVELDEGCPYGKLIGRFYITDEEFLQQIQQQQ